MKTIILLFLAVSAGCNLRGQDGGLPKTRPADFQMTYHYDGGMRYYFEDLEIGADSCSYTINDHGRKLVRRFKLNTAELDELYATLLTNQFARIRSKHEQVYDRGGESIRVNWNKGASYLNVSNAQGSFIEDGSWGHWKALIDYVHKLIRKSRS